MSVKATYFQFYFILFFIKGRSYFKAVVNDIFEFDHYIFQMNGALKKKFFFVSKQDLTFTLPCRHTIMRYVDDA